MNAHRSYIIIIISVVLLVLLACNISTAPTPDVNAISTSSAATVLAQLTKAAPPVVTAVPPSFTPPPTFTPTSTFPASAATETQAATATLSGNTIVASMPTNCREGPTSDYRQVSFLDTGQTATILGRNADKSWWYIQDPRNPGNGCWIWGGTTKASGDTAALPVFTPPPSPTPGAGTFSISLATVRKCGGDKTAIISVSNSGGSSFESASVNSFDTTANTGLADYTSDTPFMNSSNGCNGNEDTLPGSHTMYIPVGLDNAPGGHQIRVSVTLCTRDGHKGICVSNAIKFSVP